MKKQILFIHSAGTQGSHVGSGDLVTHLKAALGTKYRVIYPKMPDPEDPQYNAWKIQVEKELNAVNDEVILVGHSLGGSVLVKYLAEEKVIKSIAGLCIVAAPYWGTNGRKIKDFELQKDLSLLSEIPKIFLFHSHDDEVVPFKHLAQYAEKIPYATVHALDGYGHLYTDGCPELVAEIKRLSRKKHIKKKPVNSIAASTNTKI